MNIYSKISIVVALIGLGYVIWVLLFWKGSKNKKDSRIFSYLRKNRIFVNNSSNEQTDLDAILDQVVEETENNSELLDAFRKGSSDEDDINSLTRKKHETFKVIRNKDSADEDPPDPKT